MKLLKIFFIGVGSLLTILIGVVLYWSSISSDCLNSKVPQDAFLSEFPRAGAGNGAFLNKMEEGTWSQIFLSKKFVSIYENSCPYMPSALAILNDSVFDDGEKVAAVIAMQSLPPADYYQFAENGLALFKQGKISKRVVEFIFMPWVDLLNIPRNQWVFWHPKWRSLLKEADAAMKDPTFSKSVEEKLSGKTFWAWFNS